MKGCDVFPQLASRQPFSSLHPSVASFFKDYLSGEKAVTFGDQFVINTHFPPFPGRAFDTLANQFESLGDAHNRSLYSVTLGVTNWCGLRDACFGTDRPMESLTISSDQAHRKSSTMPLNRARGGIWRSASRLNSRNGPEREHIT